MPPTTWSQFIQLADNGHFVVHRDLNRLSTTYVPEQYDSFTTVVKSFRDVLAFAVYCLQSYRHCDYPEKETQFNQLHLRAINDVKQASAALKKYVKSYTDYQLVAVPLSVNPSDLQLQH